ncbi:hypothetical protein [Alkalibacillus filiformis]|uniref:hypothetical protein n=1 Tax=Alkalibacillus filiformis TaxID=200990 RepID=UPI0027D8ABEE|nr:hypothetical protein [Alkalibacillus filiformis]
MDCFNRFFALYLLSFWVNKRRIGTLGLAGAVALVLAFEDRKLQYSRLYPGEAKMKFNHLFYKGLISSGCRKCTDIGAPALADLR